MTQITQKQKFIETAKELGCDESEKSFDKKLSKLVKDKTAEKAPAAPKKV